MSYLIFVFFFFFFFFVPFFWTRCIRAVGQISTKFGFWKSLFYCVVSPDDTETDNITYLTCFKITIITAIMYSMLLRSVKFMVFFFRMLRHISCLNIMTLTFDLLTFDRAIS